MTQLRINGQLIDMIGESIEAINIDNCNHPCVSQPCPQGSLCVPVKDFYQCACVDGENTVDCHACTQLNRLSVECRPYNID